MADPQRTYNEAVAQARQRLIQGGLAAKVVQQMREAIVRMLIDFQQDVEDGTLTAERADNLRQSLDAALQRFRDRAVVVLEQGRRDAMQLAVEGHTAGLSSIAEETGVGISVGESFTEVPDKVLELGAARRGAGVTSSMQTLVNRSVESAGEDIDDAIESAVGRGVSNQRLTGDLATILARGSDGLQDLLDEVDGGEEIDVDADPVSLTEDDLDRLQRLEYDARRIAVSEINSHYHEADVVSGVQSPVVDLLRWRTSMLHTADKRYVPDICDVMEEADLYGYGEGLFHPAVAPALVHPFCQCRYETVLKDPEDYGTGNRDLPDQLEVEEGRLRDAMEGIEGERSITDAYVSNQRDMLQEHVDAARGVADQLIGTEQEV